MVSQNARRHGLLAINVLIPGEDPAAYESLAQRLYEEYWPETHMESLLVRRIIQHQWRLERVPKIEAGLLLERDENVPVETDGELIGNCPVEFQIRSGGLRVLAPL